MRISAKSKYAIKMLVDIAENSNREYISLTEISERQNISKKFLEQIVPMLTKSGLLRANRGNKGGYRLCKDANKCFVGEILRATDGELIPVDDLQNDSDSKIAYVIEGMHDTLNRYADSVSIQDIIEHSSGFYDYCI